MKRKSAHLSHGQKQWLEIGMLLMQAPELLLLDEPVAGMSARERELTGELLRKIAEGRSMVVIEHDMEFVRSVAQKVTVLHQGKVLAEGSMDHVQNDPRVIEVYLGH
jgi:urea transport system ATP-binding protein